MSKFGKRFVSCLLAVMMVLSLFPLSAFAFNEDNGASDNTSSTVNSEQGTEAETVDTEEALKQAVTSAGSNETTIQLNADINLNETLTIPANTEITLDLNGYTLSISTTANVIDNNGNLTVKNGTIAAKDDKKDTKGMAVNNLAGAILTVDQDADKVTKLIGRSGIQNYGTVIVNSGTIESYNRNAYWGDNGTTLTVYDGTFTSPSGSSGMGRAVSSSGNVTIYGGTFYAGGTSGAGDSYVNAIGMYDSSELVIDPQNGKNVTVTSKTDYAVASSGKSVKIYGGTFSCEGERTDILAFKPTPIYLYGGTYTHEPYAEYLAENRIVTKQEEGKYIIETTANSQSITVNSFEELNEALNSPALNPKTITIGKDITIPTEADLTLKTAFHIVVPQNVTLTVDGLLRLKGTLNNEGILTVTDKGFIEYPLQITNTGTITDFPTVENGVCTLSTPMQLQWLSCLVEWDNDNIPANIELTSDITMPDVEFTPIGNTDTLPYHNSTFNGKNHTVSNLNISVTSEYNGGFFGYIEDSTIKNLTINRASTNSTSSYIGALAGYMGGSCTVQNVNINNYTVNSPISYGVGGFIGQIWTNDATDKVEFINCSSNANVTGYANVGGIWGTSTGSQGSIGIYNCTLGGSVTTINVNGAICGGYAASAPVTVIGLDHTGLTATVKDQPTDKLLAYTTATNNLDNADATQYKAVKQNGTWTSLDISANTATADVSGVPYTSFDEAVKAAADGDIINITGEMTVNTTVTIDKDHRYWL